MSIGVLNSRSTTSCRRRGDKWLVAMNKWQAITAMEVSKGRTTDYEELPADHQGIVLTELSSDSLDMLSEYCR